MPPRLVNVVETVQAVTRRDSDDFCRENWIRQPEHNRDLRQLSGRYDVPANMDGGRSQ